MANPKVLPDHLLRRSEAAQYLGVSIQTIYSWARAGRLPYVTTLGGHMRFSRADLDRVVVRIRRRQPGPG